MIRLSSDYKVFTGVCFVVACLTLSVALRLSDSELWALSLAGSKELWTHPSFGYKPLFYLLLKFCHLVSHTDIGTLQTARIVFCSISMMILAIGSLIVWHLQQYMFASSDSSVVANDSVLVNELSPSLLGIFLFGLSAPFWMYGFQIRSDLLAGFFTALFVGFFISRALQKNTTDGLSVKTGSLQKWEWILFFTILLLLLLSTPKSIYHLTTLVVFTFTYSRLTQARWAKQVALFLVLTPLLFFALLMIAKFEIIISSFDYFKGSFSATSYRPAAFTAESFKDVFWTFFALTPFVFIFILQKFQNKQTTRTQPLLKSVCYAALSAFILMLIHNERLAFFLISLMFFPLLWIGITLPSVLSNLNQRQKFLFFLFFICINMTALYPFYERLTNSNQLKAMRQVHDYLNDFQFPLYYDGTSVLPRTSRLFVFPASEHMGNKDQVLEVLQKPDLQLVFFGNRLYSYFQDAYLALEKNQFIEVSPGVFAKVYLLPPQQKLDVQTLQKICEQLTIKEALYVYEGQHFLRMSSMKEKTLDCKNLKNEIVSRENFIALSKFKPLFFEHDLSFAQIFDSRY